MISGRDGPRSIKALALGLKPIFTTDSPPIFVLGLGTLWARSQSGPDGDFLQGFCGKTVDRSSATGDDKEWGNHRGHLGATSDRSPTLKIQPVYKGNTQREIGTWLPFAIDIPQIRLEHQPYEKPNFPLQSLSAALQHEFHSRHI